MTSDQALTVIAALLATWMFWPVIVLGLLIGGFGVYLSFELARSYVLAYLRKRRERSREQK